MSDAAKKREKGKTPWLHELRRNKELQDNERNLAGGPYAIFECTAHPDTRIIRSARTGLVPYEMICIRCARRCRATIRSELSPELWQWYVSSVMVATTEANTTT